MTVDVNKIITKCIYEVFKERLVEGIEKCPTCGTPDSKCNCHIIARMQAYKQLKSKIDGGTASPEEIAQFHKERIWVKSILKQAGYGVQGGMYLRHEGFDPTSVGPNPPASEQTQINPYKEWNMKMRKMEETFKSSAEFDFKNSFKSFKNAKLKADEIGGMVFWWMHYYIIMPEEYNETYGVAKYVSKSAIQYFKDKYKKKLTVQ